MSPLKTLVDRVQGKAPAGAKRSSRWPSVRRAFLAKNPVCAMCGGRKKLEVHHIRPFHEAPELELEESNLIVLCESKSWGVVCHQFVGHLGTYTRANPQVRDDAAYWAGKLKRGA